MNGKEYVRVRPHVLRSSLQFQVTPICSGYLVVWFLKLIPELYGLIYTVSQKTSYLWFAIVFTYTVRLQQFFAQMLPRKWAIKRYFIFPPQLTSASALPGETGNPEIASFHLNAACFFTQKHETQLKISPGQRWTTLHCQHDRLGAPDTT